MYDSEVNFFSVVDISLLISLWFCLWPFCISRSLCLILGRKKKIKKQGLLLTLNPPRSFCLSSWMLQAEGSMAPFLFFLSCDSALGTQSGLQYSQVSILQPKPSEFCTTPTVHICQPGTFNPLHCAIIWLVTDVHWVGATCTLPLCLSGLWALAKSLQGHLFPLLN